MDDIDENGLMLEKEREITWIKKQRRKLKKQTTSK